eukprot:scaffold22568_cov125-Cylindrotheca_fusiformis.AAC.17
MILNLDHWHFGYEQILNDCRAGEDGAPKTALLLCNADVDAMASARILSFMLRSDGVNYQLLPCTNYTLLEKNLRNVQDIAAVVLLNFGAARNLTRLFNDEESALLPHTIKVYVLDCRKPVHLANIYAGENVVVFMDGIQKDLPSDGDNLSGGESTSSSEDDGSEEEDGSDDSDSDSSDDDDELEEEADFDDVVGLKSKAPPQDPAYDGGDESGEDDEEGDGPEQQETNDAEEEDSEEPSNKRRRIDNEEEAATEDAPPLDLRELHRQRRDRLRNYYSSGSFYGSPAAYIAYRLAAQLRFGDQGDLLWLACVGVTDAYLHARLDFAGYTQLTQSLKEYCFRLFPNDMYERVSNTVYAEDLAGTGGGGANGERTKITFSDNGRIVSQNDYRFFLLRYSSLLESMINSDYISTKLQVSTKHGMQKLQELLAKMGFPLDECRQPFAFMKPGLKRRLQEKLSENAQDYNLGTWEFTSFFRVTGFKSLLSASDTSHAVTALLECETPATVASEGVTEEDKNSNAMDEDKIMIESFNIAYDALNSNTAPVVGLNGLIVEGRDTSSLVNGSSLSGNTGLAAGLRLAMSLQKTIINTAVSLVDREAITRLRHFRYAYLTCTSAGENQTARSNLIRTSTSNTSADDDTANNKSHVFAKPLALSRLAQYLMDMHRENGKWAGAKSRPLVLMAEKPRTGTYLVVGYEYPERSGTFIKNKFGNNFELTAKSMNGTFKFDSFDSNVVEVGGDDVQRFIEQLHYLMDSI